jgi:type II secretory pathway component PulC
MMGLRNGDIIKSVNRQAVDSPEKAFEAYQKFKNESQIEVVVRRNNNDLTLRYDINQ